MENLLHLANQNQLLDSSDDDLDLIIESAMDSSTCASSLSSDSGESRNTGVDDFVGTVDSFSDCAFVSNFRLQRDTVTVLIDMYENSNVLPACGADSRIVGAKKEILIFLWYMANTITYRQMAILFNLAKSTIRNVIIRVAAWIISIGHNFVTWPADPTANTAKFEERRGIPGVVGAIDCTHIKICAPLDHKQDFFNRKHTYSIVLQAVVDADLKFIDIYCGQPGSLHDSRVFRKSELYNKVRENYDAYFPRNTFIIGDSAYNQSNWLIPPFKNYGAITQLQKDFNFIHSSTRMPIEMAFGLLKTRFRRLLHFCELRDLNLIVNLVLSACVLHNMCIIQKDVSINAEEFPNYETDSDDEDNFNNGQRNRREQLIEELLMKRVLRL